MGNERKGETPHPRSDGTILTAATTWRIHERSDMALLIDGRDYYRAFYAAALRARKSILLLGWQFDSDVELVRGDDLPNGAAPEDVQLVALLDRLCRERPELQTRILAWDHSVFFALERELLQKLYFDVNTCERFTFAWDDSVPFGGSHHQKVAIIDGVVAFFGSQDICHARWDDSNHRADNDHRTSRGEAHRPYHEVQVAVMGDAARSMLDLFIWRWSVATGENLDPHALLAVPDEKELDFPVTLRMPPARLGLARTIPAFVGRPEVHEVSNLYVRAIEQAEVFVYIESQFLTSCAVRDALIERMRDPSRSRLDIVMIVPHKPSSLKEEMTIGVPQSACLQALDRIATEEGHALGIYNVVAGTDANGDSVYVYVHSKLMIVDDRYFLVGSANLTNRSMTIDSEIVAAYEAGPGDRAVRNAIRRARVRLMMEHASGACDVRSLVRPKGVVERLNRLIARRAVRLRKHDLHQSEPSVIAKAVHELTLEFLDPWDGPPWDGGDDDGENCTPAA